MITTQQQTISKSPLISLSTRGGILRRKCACGNHTIAGGECADCAKKKMGLQRKLIIGASNDPLEQEADRIADQVVAMPEGGIVNEQTLNWHPQTERIKKGNFPSARIHLLQRTPRRPPFNGKLINNFLNSVWAWSDDRDYYQIPGRSHSDFENDDVDFVQDRNGQWYKIGAMTTTIHEDGHVSQYVCRSTPPPEGECFPIHGLPDRDAGAYVARSLQHKSSDHSDIKDVPPIVYETLRSSGQPLPTDMRNFMESRFGYDFSQVRVHTDVKAAESARRMNAIAYTVGRDIVFGVGGYEPFTIAGRRLIAHELTHVVQQSYVDSVAGQSDDKHGLSTISAIDSVSQPSPHSTLPSLQRQLGGEETGRSCPEIEIIHEDNLFDPALTQVIHDIGCVSSESRVMAPSCRLTSRQERLLRTEQQMAAARVQRAMERIGSGVLAIELARRLFYGAPPSVDDVVARLRAIRDLLVGSTVRFEGRTCGDEMCRHPGTLAYVVGAGRMPFFICLRAFSQSEGLHRTVLHEALHWSGLDVDPDRPPEVYCERFDCQTPCLTIQDADAWTHYLDCLGRPIEMRRDFRRELRESAHEVR